MGGNNQRSKPKQSILILYGGLLIGLIPSALQARGVAVNAWVAAIIFLISFCLIADYIFRHSPKTKQWEEHVRGGAVVVVALIFIVIWELTRPPIVTVAPDTFVLHTGEWFEKTRITVTNVTDKPIYAVQIKIWSDNPRIKLREAVVLEEYEPQQEPNLPSPDIGLQFADESVEVRLSELLGHKDRHIVVTGPSMPANSGTAHGFARITAFSDTPQDRYHKTLKE